MVSWLHRRASILVAMLAIVIFGMALSFWLNPITHRGSGWFVSTDLWNTFRAAQYVGWGFEGEIYKSQTYFDSFPGIAVLLAPIAKLASLWHMSVSFPMYLSRPTAWLILGPVEMILGGVLLFPLDALARRLQVSTRRRTVLIWLEAALVFTVVAIWGHPEYTVALAFGIYGLIAAFDDKWVRVGIFFGLALLFQPLMLLMMPVGIALIPPRRWIQLGSLIALPSALLLIPPLVKEWTATTYVLLRQPNYPRGDHATPWISLAPVLHRAHSTLQSVVKTVKLPDGKETIKTVMVHVRVAEVVSSGPGRVIALALACAIGVWIAKKRPPLAQVVWWAGVTLALRCVFECVMNPYYLMPGLAIVLVCAVLLSSPRLLGTVLAATACGYLSYRVMAPWTYYLIVTGLLFVVLASAWPGVATSSPDDADAVTLSGDGATFVERATTAFE
jgi:hypothetical protein